MPTDPVTGVSDDKVIVPFTAGQVLELSLAFAIADGVTTTPGYCQPDNMVGPAQPGKSFSVQYISIFCHMPQGQAAQIMFDQAGGQWFALFHQGTFGGYEVYVCSQITAFTIPPAGGNFYVTRSDSAGVGNVNVHLVGSFSD